MKDTFMLMNGVTGETKEISWDEYSKFVYKKQAKRIKNVNKSFHRMNKSAKVFLILFSIITGAIIFFGWIYTQIIM